MAARQARWVYGDKVAAEYLRLPVGRVTKLGRPASFTRISWASGAASTRPSLTPGWEASRDRDRMPEGPAEGWSDDVPEWTRGRREPWTAAAGSNRGTSRLPNSARLRKGTRTNFTKIGAWTVSNPSSPGNA